MGVILFTIIFVASVYWFWFHVLPFSNSTPISSRRELFALGYPRASTRVEPVIIPVDDVEKIPARLPQVEFNFDRITAPIPSTDPATEVSPNFTTTPSKVEESLLFRSLILAMFAVSIIGVDFTAGTHFSAVGIPFTTTGSIWSWYRRYHAKHWLNILVLVVSIGIAIGVFVPIIFTQIPMAIEQMETANKLSATLELTLGSIAITLQMGLSFALYSRRVLGYCLLISGILIGVTAGLSQNLGFLILLWIWMTIAIPSLMLDYRSRLALIPIGIESSPSQGKLSDRNLPWQYLTQLAAIAIGLGLILSIFLPNFHFPDLSLKQAGLDRLQTLAQKTKSPNPHPPLSPSPSSISPPPPQLSTQALASKVFGQPGNNNYPDSIKQENLQLPPEISSQLKQFTQQILTTSPQPLNSDFDRSTYLAEYLKQHHQPAPPPSNPTNLPPLDPKLIQQLIAKCTPDPSACKMVGNQQDLPVVYTSMLRSIDIPARLKTGDKLAQIDPQTKLYPRPPAQPSSQTEMYAPNWGWVPLDPQPDRPVLNLTAAQQTQLRSGFTGFKDEQDSVIGASGSPPPVPSPNHAPAQPDPNTPSNHPSPSPTPPAELPKLDLNPGFLKTIAVTMVIVGVFATYLFRYRHQQQLLANLPPIERIYRSMIISLSKTGNSKLPAQTQLEYAHSIKNTEHPQIAQVTAEISQLYTAWRYGHQNIDANLLARKLHTLQYLQQLSANRKRQQWFAQKKLG